MGVIKGMLGVQTIAHIMAFAEEVPLHVETDVKS